MSLSLPEDEKKKKTQKKAPSKSNSRSARKGANSKSNSSSAAKGKSSAKSSKKTKEEQDLENYLDENQSEKVSKHRKLLSKSSLSSNQTQSKVEEQPNVATQPAREESYIEPQPDRTSKVQNENEIMQPVQSSSVEKPLQIDIDASANKDEKSSLDNDGTDTEKDDDKEQEQARESIIETDEVVMTKEFIDECMELPEKQRLVKVRERLKMDIQYYYND